MPPSIDPSVLHTVQNVSPNEGSGALRTASQPPQGRPPRSRKDRPCDNCRRSKSRCFIHQHGFPCSKCNDTGRACTFEKSPPKRPVRLRSPDEDTGFSGTESMGEMYRAGYGSSNHAGSMSPAAKRSRIGEHTSLRPESHVRQGLEHGDEGLDTTLPESSFDHLANSRYEPHGESRMGTVMYTI